MPDYLYSEEGLRIDGVSKGKTADIYGVQKGDIIIKIGKKEVINIMDYMEGLSKFKKNEKTILKVLRNNKTLDIPIIFQ